jgi:hypothetical protein|tara:strand:- start:186 stop:362 length:177 start_codon:yes stop_codon:yes gene_type:complete
MNMSKQQHEERQEQIIEEVSSMTVDEFQNELEEYHIDGVQSIDEMVNQLVESKMELGE